MQLGQPLTLFLIYLLLNLIVFCVYWWDKQAARQGQWRISENTLLTLALVGGSFGAVTAQRVLRHKTRKEPFRSILMTIVVFHIGIGIFWLVAPPGALVAALQAINVR